MLKYYPRTYIVRIIVTYHELVFVLGVIYDAFDLRVTLTEHVPVMHRASLPNARPDRNEYTTERDTVFIFSLYSLQHKKDEVNVYV